MKLTQAQKIALEKSFYINAGLNPVVVLSDALSVSFSLYDDTHGVTCFVIEKLSVAKGVEVLKVGFSAYVSELYECLEDWEDLL